MNEKKTMLTELENNQVNEIPWTCYHPFPMRTYDDECHWDGENYSFKRVPRVRPDFEGVVSFVDRRGRTLQFSRILGLGPNERFHDYVLAGLIGEWILTGKRVLDLNNLSTRIRIKNLCRKIKTGAGAELEKSVYGRDKDDWWTGSFIKVYTEFQYQTTPISPTTARNLRFYESKRDPGYDDECEVHHILPKCEFEEYETDLRNLVELPKPVHQLLHNVYASINDGAEPGEAFCTWWLGAVLPCEPESEQDVDLPCCFFEDLYNEWFERRTDESVIHQQITREMGIPESYGLDRARFLERFYAVKWCNYGSDTGKVYVFPKGTSTNLPWWWHPHQAMIANMCAYIYADHLHRELS